MVYVQLESKKVVMGINVLIKENAASKCRPWGASGEGSKGDGFL